MGHTESFDPDIPDHKSAAGGKNLIICEAVEISGDGFLSKAIAIKGDFVAVTQDIEALSMVGMLMGKDNGVNILDFTADFLEALGNLFAAKAGINEDSRLVCLQISAISAAATAKDSKSNHDFTINFLRMKTRVIFLNVIHSGKSGLYFSPCAATKARNGGN